MSVGVPQFHYHIPYGSQTPKDGTESPHAHWHVIITTTGQHFYFNSVLRTSSWQLHDIKTIHQFSTTEWDEFVKSIQYDDIALLVAKVRGLKGLGKDVSPVTQEVDEESQQENNKNNKTPEDHDKHEKHGINDGDDQHFPDGGNSDSEDDESEVDIEARDAFIGNLLKEEGFIKDKPAEAEVSQQTASNDIVAGLVGYSSSEEEDSDEDQAGPGSNEANSVSENQARVPQEAGENAEMEENESDDDINTGLNLSLSDGEEEAAGTAREAEFVGLLESLGEKISLYESWPMIEEELISELVQIPEFYAVGSTEVREEIFNVWVQQKLAGRSEQIDPVTSPEPQKYPTPRIEYFWALQPFKSDIKKLFYQEFFNQHQEELQEIDLTKREREDSYREFKVMITDFSKYERSVKKSGLHDPSRNLKREKLHNFLLQNTARAPVSRVEDTEDKPHQGDAYTEWINLLNIRNLPKEIAESCTNFIVGDEKRLSCYQEFWPPQPPSK